MRASACDRYSWALSPVASLSWLRDRQQPVFAGRRGQLPDPRAEHEPALRVPGQQAMALQRDREPVRRRPGQAGRLDQLGQ
jgi:hypothetical protein